MRWLVLLIGLPVAAGLTLVSMLANWRFGVRLGAEEGDALAYGLASISADGLKVLLPFAIGWAWQRRRVAEWLAGACLWSIIFVYSLVSALSFAAVNRAEITDRKIAQGRIYADLQARLSAKRSEREQLPTARPMATVAAEIQAAEQSPRWHMTRQCSEAEGREVRAFCERLFRLRAEHGIAQRADALDAELADIRNRLARLPVAAVARSADPQLDLLQELSGVGESRIKAALAILVCLLIELGSGLGLFVVMSYHRALADEAGRRNDPPVPPIIDLTARAIPTDDDWVRERVERSGKATIGAAELYADYRLWMEARGRSNVMTVTAFGRWMSDLGLAREKAGGRIIYRGARLRSYKITSSFSEQGCISPPNRLN